MELPNVGVFRIRNGVAAVAFNDFLMRDAKISTHNYLNTENKKLMVESNLNKDTLKQFTSYKTMENDLLDKPDDILQIDQKARDFLKTSLKIDLNNFTGSKLFGASVRPMSSKGLTKSMNQWQPEKTIRPNSVTGRRIYIRNKQVQSDAAFRKLKAWIRGKGLSTEDVSTESDNECKIERKNLASIKL